MRIMRRTAFAAAATAALAFSPLAHAADAAATGTAADATAKSAQGVVGVCVRWSDDDHHLAEAVVVDSSGDKDLDTAVPETLRSMVWEKPDGYLGQWLGLSIGAGGAQPSDKLPDCGELGDVSATANIPLNVPHGKRI